MFIVSRITPKSLTDIWKHFQYQVDVVNLKDMQEIEMKQTLYELLVKYHYQFCPNSSTFRSI